MKAIRVNAIMRRTCLKLDTYVDKYNLLFQWNILAPQFLHSLVQRHRSARAVQSPRTIHQVAIKRRHNLLCNLVVDGPHRTNHTAKSGELHSCSEMDRLVKTLLIAYSGVASR